MFLFRALVLLLAVFLLGPSPGGVAVEEQGKEATPPPPAHRAVLVGGWFDLYLVDVDSRRVEGVIALDQTAQDLAVSADGRRAYAATDAGLAVIDLPGRKRVELRPWGKLDSLEWLASSGLLAVLVCPGETPFQPAQAHEVRLVEPASGRTAGSFPYSPRAYDIAASADGRFLYGSQKVGRIVAWASLERPAEARFRDFPLGDGAGDLQRMTRVATLAPAVGPEGAPLLYGVETPGEERPMVIWRASLPAAGQAGEPKVERLVTRRVGSAQGAATDAAGRTLFVNCRDHLLVFDLLRREEEAWVPLPQAHRWLAVQEDGSRVFLTCTEEEGVGYLTEVRREGGGWRVSARIDLPGSVNAVTILPAAP